MDAFERYDRNVADYVLAAELERAGVAIAEEEDWEQDLENEGCLRYVTLDCSPEKAADIQKTVDERCTEMKAPVKWTRLWSLFIITGRAK